jgi:hypothetical protein
MFDENTIDETILTGDVRAEVSFARDNGPGHTTDVQSFDS